MVLCVTKERVVLKEGSSYFANPHGSNEKVLIKESEALGDYINPDSFNKRIDPLDKIFPHTVTCTKEPVIGEGESKAEYTIIGMGIKLNVHISRNSIYISIVDNKKKGEAKTLDIKKARSPRLK